MYFHFTRFPMILYLFHYFFIVFAATWITSPLLEWEWSYPLSYTINALFTGLMSGFVYWVLLHFEITRNIFSLRQFDPEKDFDSEGEKRLVAITSYSYV